MLFSNRSCKSGVQLRKFPDVIALIPTILMAIMPNVHGKIHVIKILLGNMVNRWNFG